MAAMLGRGHFGDVRLVEPASLELALQPHSARVMSPERRAEATRAYGFQWQVVTDSFHPVEAPWSAGSFYHSGSDGTIAWADPSRDLLIVFLTQSRGGDVTQRFVRLIYDALVQ
jgi:CubicO group peptidase (beta-lactamase class C family)